MWLTDQLAGWLINLADCAGFTYYSWLLLLLLLQLFSNRALVCHNVHYSQP